MLTGYLSVNRDITKRKLSEQIAHRENERFNILAELMSVFIKVTDDYTFALDYTVKKLVEHYCDLCVVYLYSPEEERLIESAYFHNIPEAMSDLKIIFDNNSSFFDAGLAAETFLTTKPLLIPVVDDYTRFRKVYTDFCIKYGMSSILFVPIEDEKEFIGSIGMFRSNPGNPFTEEDSFFLQNIAGKVAIAISKVRMNNALNERQEQLKKALTEKEVLLKELYHRTKNNMQIVYSLLRLKSDTVDNESVKNVLNEMGNRILALSLVHQKLYQSKDLTKIDLKEYLYDLAVLIDRNYNLTEGRVKITTKLDTVEVVLDTAIPCGLMINELMSNAYKYAFPDGMKGEISITLSKLDDDYVKLSIEDNGIGLPPGKELTGGNTLGFELFKSIAQDQLNGELVVDSSHGLSCTVIFKNIYANN